MCAFLVGTLVAPVAEAAGYNGKAAAAYAKIYACNNNTACRNKAYVNYYSNCTNFVSQALLAGGKKEVESGYPFWAYGNKNVHSRSWSSVDHFLEFWEEPGKKRSTVTHYTKKMGSAYTSAAKGDVYVYDWGKGDGWSHLAIATGYGNFVNYYDVTARKNYNSVTGGSGDKIAQHSTDRDGAPWNWGYHGEPDKTVKAKMRTKILHISN